MDELRQLEAEAVAVESSGAAAVQAVAVQAAGTESAELLGALQVARMLAAPAMSWWPEFGTVWGDSTLSQIASAGGEIMARQGWTMGGAMDRWGPYIGLLTALAPAAAVTYSAVQQRRAQIAAEAKRGSNGGHEQTGD